jgi:hypothetical protein
MKTLRHYFWWGWRQIIPGISLSEEDLGTQPSEKARAEFITLP